MRPFQEWSDAFDALRRIDKPPPANPRQAKQVHQARLHKRAKKQAEAFAIACELFPNKKVRDTKSTVEITDAVNAEWRKRTDKRGNLITDKPMAAALGREPRHAARRKARRNI
jgi:hypothetical protein